MGSLDHHDRTEKKNNNKEKNEFNNEEDRTTITDYAWSQLVELHTTAYLLVRRSQLHYLHFFDVLQKKSSIDLVLVINDPLYNEEQNPREGKTSGEQQQKASGQQRDSIGDIYIYIYFPA
eukprot:gene1453-843_t